MADEQTKEQAVAEKPKTEAELLKEMKAAVDSGDYKAVAKVSQELVKAQKAKEQAEMEAKQKVLAEKTDKVKAAIQNALKPLIDAKELDKADGVWFTWDFGEKLTACRLMKNQPRKSGGGGGGGKKFTVSTTELLEKFGAEDYKDGMNFQQAWDSNTDKNWRYAIREALLKKGGHMS